MSLGNRIMAVNEPARGRKAGTSGRNLPRPVGNGGARGRVACRCLLPALREANGKRIVMNKA